MVHRWTDSTWTTFSLFLLDGVESMVDDDGREERENKKQNKLNSICERSGAYLYRTFKILQAFSWCERCGNPVTP